MYPILGVSEKAFSNRSRSALWLLLALPLLLALYFAAARHWFELPPDGEQNLQIGLFGSCVLLCLQAAGAGIVALLFRRRSGSGQVFLARFRVGLGAILAIAFVSLVLQVVLFGIVLGGLPGGSRGISSALAVIVTAFWGLLAVVRLSQTQLRRFSLTHHEVDAKVLLPEEAPRLDGDVKQIASEIGVPAPEHVVIGKNPYFFVTDAPFLAGDTRLSGRTLYVSSSILSLLDLEHAKALIALELAYAAASEQRFFERLHRGLLRLNASLDALSRHKIVGLTAASLLWFFENRVRRELMRVTSPWELEADRRVSSWLSKDRLIEALVRVHWLTEPIEMRDKPAYPEEMVGPLMERVLPNPVRVHLPLGQRLSALGVTEASKLRELERVDPSVPNIAMKHWLKGVGLAFRE
jgi:hypothetical protein